jgi:SAM-dependent methyltransferase
MCIAERGLPVRAPAGYCRARRMDAEAAQRAHYNAIAADYDAHYGDPSTREYRERFIEGPLLEGIDLNGRQVLEAMCVSGMTTSGLLARGAVVTGLDISDECIAAFRRRWPASPALCRSITDTGLAADAFDAVVVVGGLHHLQPRIEPGIDEIHRILKPGGWFCFLEPHVGSLPDVFRRQWYKRDRRFAPNEAAVDIESLKARYGDRFEFRKESYCGNVGFLFVYNSMIFKLPLALKRYYTRPLLRLEGLLNRIVGKRLGCIVICQWRKRLAPGTEPSASAR